MGGATFGLKLAWVTCLDGVELIERRAPPPYEGPPNFFAEVAHQLEPGWDYRDRSERSNYVELEARITFDQLIALDFINARTDQKRAAFLSKRGHLFRTGGRPNQVTDAAELLARQHVMRSYVKAAASSDVPAAIAAVNGAFDDSLLSPSFELVEGEARVVLHPRSLWQYMAMEIASAAMCGTRYAECHYCGDAYLTGPMTSRRSHAKYCSGRCRVAALRARNRLGSIRAAPGLIGSPR